jgi:hypothetical protein
MVCQTSSHFSLLGSKVTLPKDAKAYSLSIEEYQQVFSIK